MAGQISPAGPSRRTVAMKYIRHRELGFVLFEGSVRHDEVAKKLGGSDQIVSAGFVFTPAFEPRCLGYSGTLNLSAGPSAAVDLRRRMTSA